MVKDIHETGYLSSISVRTLSRVSGAATENETSIEKSNFHDFHIKIYMELYIY